MNRFAESQLWGNSFGEQLWGTTLGSSAGEQLWAAALGSSFGQLSGPALRQLRVIDPLPLTLEYLGRGKAKARNF